MALDVSRRQAPNLGYPLLSGCGPALGWGFFDGGSESPGPRRFGLSSLSPHGSSVPYGLVLGRGGERQCPCPRGECDSHTTTISPCWAVGKQNGRLALHPMDRRRAQRFYRPCTGLNEGELNAEDGWNAGIRNRVPLNADKGLWTIDAVEIADGSWADGSIARPVTGRVV